MQLIKKITETDRERFLQNFLNYPAPYADWRYLGPVRTWDGGLREGAVGVMYSLTGPKSFEVRPGKPVVIPRIAKDQEHWMSVFSSRGSPDPTMQQGSNWFLERLSPVIAVSEPDFAFADNDLAIVRNLDGIDVEPHTLAWPLMIFGPSMVQKIGRDKLLDSPAWKVEELSYGGIWVQVWENPFDTPQKMVTALGKHLGLEPRQG
jgi:hypothetical protein